MGQLTTLLNAVQNLDSFDAEFTIYAAKPWTSTSKAMVALESDSGNEPSEANALGLHYFLEIYIAQDFLESWVSSLKHTPTIEEKCARLIKYAISDA
jgi:hypothetical protein